MSKKFVMNSFGILAAVMLVLFFASNAPAPDYSPNISVTKSCTDASAPGMPITFTAIVTNTGTDALASISCSDDPPTSLTGVPSSLAAGQYATITGSYVPTTNPSTDTITCSGTGVVSVQTVTSSASATCKTVEVTSGISVTKSCTDASAPGMPITFIAIVTNTGTDAIDSISCSDDPPTSLTGVPSSLSVGASATITGSYVPTTNPSTDTITCIGTGAVSGSPLTASASATCRTVEGGCTLTPGYWKTHSIYGPARYDDTWAGIGENTTFFLSGQSYYQVLWTNPKGGNAYYILAHQFIAAKLNALGASVPGNVTAAMNAATALFDAYTPAQIGALGGDDAIRAQFITYAGILDAYNNGIIGPGHCPY